MSGLSGLPPLLVPPEEDEDEDEEEEEELDEELLEDELLDVETLPLDVELEVETLPLDVETFPLDVDTLPLDVEEELPPVEVELEMPPVELLVDEITTVLPLEPPPDPPKKPPTKKPPPKPPPPELPPITIGTPPLVLATGGSGTGAGANTGTLCVTVRVVTAPAAAPAAPATPATPAAPAAGTHATRRTVRRTTRRCPLLRLAVAVRRTVVAFAFACWTTAGRGGGFSAMCTAPPPRTAPPHVQAQSLANAILTDISASCSWPLHHGGNNPSQHRRLGCNDQMQMKSFRASALTMLRPGKRAAAPVAAAFVPELNSVPGGVKSAGADLGRGGGARSAVGPDSDRFAHWAISRVMLTNMSRSRTIFDHDLNGLFALAARRIGPAGVGDLYKINSGPAPRFGRPVPDRKTRSGGVWLRRMLT